MAGDAVESEEIRRFEEQYRSNPDSLVFARLADAHRKGGDPERGLSILAEGIRRHPDYPSAYIVRARCLIDLDRPAEAEASLRRVLELDGQNLVAMRGLASLAEKRGDPVEAVHWFEQIASLDPMNAEAEVALERLRRSLPRTPPGLEPLPAPREEWWSSPAFQIEDAEAGEAGGKGETPPAAGPEEPDVSEEEAEEPGVAEPRPLPGAAEEPAPPTSGGEAWWFEDPGDTEAAEDGDLLTRTMAELYARQGLTDEAAAIYRELLRDRPEDEELRHALERLEGGAEDEEDGAIVGASDEAVKAVKAEEAVKVEEVEVAEKPPVETAADAPEERPASADPYASHPVPAGAGDGEVFRAWLRRLAE